MWGSQLGEVIEDTRKMPLHRTLRAAHATLSRNAARPWACLPSFVANVGKVRVAINLPWPVAMAIRTPASRAVKEQASLPKVNVGTLPRRSCDECTTRASNTTSDTPDTGTIVAEAAPPFCTTNARNRVCSSPPACAHPFFQGLSLAAACFLDLFLVS